MPRSSRDRRMSVLAGTKRGSAAVLASFFLLFGWFNTGLALADPEPSTPPSTPSTPVSPPPDAAAPSAPSAPTDSSSIGGTATSTVGPATPPPPHAPAPAGPADTAATPADTATPAPTAQASPPAAKQGAQGSTDSKGKQGKKPAGKPETSPAPAADPAASGQGQNDGTPVGKAGDPPAHAPQDGTPKQPEIQLPNVAIPDLSVTPKTAATEQPNDKAATPAKIVKLPEPLKALLPDWKDAPPEVAQVRQVAAHNPVSQLDQDSQAAALPVLNDQQVHDLWRELGHDRQGPPPDSDVHVVPGPGGLPTILNNVQHLAAALPHPPVVMAFLNLAAGAVFTTTVPFGAPVVLPAGWCGGGFRAGASIAWSATVASPTGGVNLAGSGGFNVDASCGVVRFSAGAALSISIGGVLYPVGTDYFQPQGCACIQARNTWWRGVPQWQNVNGQSQWVLQPDGWTTDLLRQPMAPGAPVYANASLAAPLPPAWPWWVIPAVLLLGVAGGALQWRNKPAAETLDVDLPGGHVTHVDLGQPKSSSPITVGLLAALAGLAALLVAVQVTHSWSFLELIGIHWSP